LKNPGPQVKKKPGPTNGLSLAGIGLLRIDAQFLEMPSALLRVGKNFPSLPGRDSGRPGDRFGVTSNAGANTREWSLRPEAVRLASQASGEPGGGQLDPVQPSCNRWRATIRPFGAPSKRGEKYNGGGFSGFGGDGKAVPRRSRRQRSPGESRCKN